MISWTLIALPFNLTSTSEAGIYGYWKLWFILQSTKFSELFYFTFLAYLYITAAEVKKNGKSFELKAKNYLLHMNFSPVLGSLPRFCPTLARGPSDPTHLVLSLVAHHHLHIQILTSPIHAWIHSTSSLKTLPQLAEQWPQWTPWSCWNKATWTWFRALQTSVSSLHFYLLELNRTCSFS